MPKIEIKGQVVGNVIVAGDGKTVEFRQDGSGNSILIDGKPVSPGANGNVISGDVRIGAASPSSTTPSGQVEEPSQPRTGDRGWSRYINKEDSPKTGQRIGSITNTGTGNVVTVRGPNPVVMGSVLVSSGNAVNIIRTDGASVNIPGDLRGGVVSVGQDNRVNFPSAPLRPGVVSESGRPVSGEFDSLRAEMERVTRPIPPATGIDLDEPSSSSPKGPQKGGFGGIGNSKSSSKPIDFSSMGNKPSPSFEDAIRRTVTDAQLDKRHLEKIGADIKARTAAELKNQDFLLVSKESRGVVTVKTVAGVLAPAALAAAITAAGKVYDEAYDEAIRSGSRPDEANQIATERQRSAIMMSFGRATMISAGAQGVGLIGGLIHEAAKDAKAAGSSGWLTRLAANSTVASYAGGALKWGGRLLGPVLSAYEAFGHWRAGEKGAETKADANAGMERAALVGAVNLIPLVGVSGGGQLAGVLFDEYAENPLSQGNRAQYFTPEEGKRVEQLKAQHDAYSKLDRTNPTYHTTETLAEISKEMRGIYQGAAQRGIAAYAQALNELEEKKA